MPSGRSGTPRSSVFGMACRSCSHARCRCDAADQGGAEQDVCGMHVQHVGHEDLRSVRCLPIIGRLLGHRRLETIPCHAHLACGSLRGADERNADSIATDVL